MNFTKKLIKVETPAWMLDLFKALDALDTSDNSGFKIFDENITMQFGANTVQGLDNVKQFFIKLDTPLITKHFVAEVFKCDQVYLMNGGAEISKKGGNPDEKIQAAPVFNLFWFNKEGKVIKYVTDAPPEAMDRAN
ncbi:hypothetical protein DFQ04_1118 [Algoriphagus boseongensis]|uniref:SnoaL-like domain-containing protein n=1 Tax=Algoriphagus boseongensis TaxID=1442587 RepID=A0A4V3D2K6_9BACT|nr:hypothetical protein [Algoriphagus boseongensis]TDQ19297.1 hypothetical protein DFQ04_1118 [Algoriphagus boseongensis]